MLRRSRRVLIFFLTRAGFSSAPRPQISIAHGIRSVLVTTSVVSTAATIQPPEVRRTAITRGWLCWNDHADKSEREGTFQRKCRMKRCTFKKLVEISHEKAHLQDACLLRSSESTIKTLYLRFRRDSTLI